MKVIIVGAGIGGSCLAHGLLKSGIEVKVFERNARHLLGLPGYGIHVNPFGQQAMRECLPENNWKDFLSRAAAIGGHHRFFDEKLRLLSDVTGSHMMNGRVIAEDRLSISRTELREILLKGLSGESGGWSVIEWEKTFDRYELISDGRVEVFLHDGAHETADVLVGADASNSRVRKQYLPNIERTGAKVSLILGRTKLSRVETTSFPPALFDGSPNTVIPKTAESMFVSVWRAPVDTKAEPSQAVIDSFVVWAYIGAEKTFPPGVESFSQQELLELAMHRSQRFDGRLRRVMRASELDSVSLVPLRTMPRLPSWSSSAVTLLGDAIHNMTPMAGIGANTALRDARLLCNALLEVSERGRSLEDAIADYEEQMRRYANKAVVQSLQNAQNAVSDSRFRRSVFRMLLRIAEAVPALKARMFPAGR